MKFGTFTKILMKYKIKGAGCLLIRSWLRKCKHVRYTKVSS